MTTDNNEGSIPKQPSWRSLATNDVLWDVFASIFVYFFCFHDVGRTITFLVIMLLCSVIILKVRRVRWQMKYNPAANQ